MRAALVTVLGLACLAAPAAAQQAHLLVIVGLPGDPENADRFHHWASTIVDAARGRFALAPESVVYLASDPARDPARIAGRSTREGIAEAAGRIAARARPGDRVFVVLIGHGAAAEGEARFNLPGPDMTTRDYAALVGRFAAQSVAFVNTASASGGFVKALSGPGRTIIAATRTEGERNMTRFGEFFAEAFAAPEADLDRDGRLSMAEAFAWAQRRVVESYARDGQLLTEHAVLDDNGDGAGADTLGQPGGDGAAARATFLSAEAGEPAAPAETADPALAKLYAERKALEDRVAALTAARATIDAARYARELEALLVALARTSREIREKEKR